MSALVVGRLAGLLNFHEHHSSTRNLIFALDSTVLLHQHNFMIVNFESL
jgi:hypothetical protein